MDTNSVFRWINCPQEANPLHGGKRQRHALRASQHPVFSWKKRTVFTMLEALLWEMALTKKKQPDFDQGIGGDLPVPLKWHYCLLCRFWRRVRLTGHYLTWKVFAEEWWFISIQENLSESTLTSRGLIVPAWRYKFCTLLKRLWWVWKEKKNVSETSFCFFKIYLPHFHAARLKGGRPETESHCCYNLIDRPNPQTL